MSISTFEKSLLRVIKGVQSIEEFSERIVRSAVSETMQRVSDTYGLNGAILRERFLESIVLKYARAISEEPKCTAITYRGKKCTNDAIADGHCQLHSRQQIKQKKRKDISHGENEDIASKCARIFTSVGQSSAANQPPSMVSQSSDCTPFPTSL